MAAKKKTSSLTSPLVEAYRRRATEIADHRGRVKAALDGLVAHLEDARQRLCVPIKWDVDHQKGFVVVYVGLNVIEVRVDAAGSEATWYILGDRGETFARMLSRLGEWMAAQDS